MLLCGQVGGQKEKTKLTAAFCDFVDVPKRNLHWIIQSGITLISHL
jgi:hypothetical protein